MKTGDRVKIAARGESLVIVEDGDRAADAIMLFGTITDDLGDRWRVQLSMQFHGQWAYEIPKVPWRGGAG